jgi:hypothetical protein
MTTKEKEENKIKEYNNIYYLLSCWNLVQKYGDFFNKNV